MYNPITLPKKTRCLKPGSLRGVAFTGTPCPANLSRTHVGPVLSASSVRPDTGAIHGCAVPAAPGSARARHITPTIAATAAARAAGHPRPRGRRQR